MRKQSQRTGKKNIVIERAARLNGRFRVALRTAAMATISRCHSCISLLERGAATCAVRVRNLSATCGKAANQMWTAVKGSLRSISPRTALGAASLLALILLETVYFRAAHISPLMAPRMQTGSSLNDSVDAMYARVKRESSWPGDEPPQLAKHSLPMPEPPGRANKLDQTDAIQNRNEGSPKQEITPVDKTYHMKKGAIVRPGEPEPQTLFSPTKPQGETVASEVERRSRTLESAHALSRPQPDISRPVRVAQNSAPNRQLNVKWEN